MSYLHCIVCVLPSSYSQYYRVPISNFHFSIVSRTEIAACSPKTLCLAYMIFTLSITSVLYQHHVIIVYLFVIRRLVKDRSAML